MKASKMVACLSVSAVLLSLFASGASVTVPDTQPSAAAVLQAEEYVEDSLAAYLAEMCIRDRIWGSWPLICGTTGSK